MTKDEAELLKKRMETHLTRVRAEIEELETFTQPIAPENSLGRVSRMDAINNKGVMDYSLREAKKKMNNLESMLAKYGTEKFGKCFSCGDEILYKRLLAMPQSVQCMRCAGQ